MARRLAWRADNRCVGSWCRSRKRGKHARVHRSRCRLPARVIESSRPLSSQPLPGGPEPPGRRVACPLRRLRGAGSAPEKNPFRKGSLRDFSVERCFAEASSACDFANAPEGKRLGGDALRIAACIGDPIAHPVENNAVWPRNGAGNSRLSTGRDRHCQSPSKSTQRPKAAACCSADRRLRQRYAETQLGQRIQGRATKACSALEASSLLVLHASSRCGVEVPEEPDAVRGRHRLGIAGIHLGHLRRASLRLRCAVAMHRTGLIG